MAVWAFGTMCASWTAEARAPHEGRLVGAAVRVTFPHAGPEERHDASDAGSVGKSTGCGKWPARKETR
jgi:hypothetical protein